MKLNLPLMGAALSLALGLNAQTGRKAAINQSPAQKMIQTQSFPNRGCGTQAPGEEWNNWFNNEVEKFKANLPAGKSQMVNYTIPVIVHVIHTGQAIGTFPNIAQAQINSQITVLNQDFASNGLNVGNLPAVFASAKANTGLQFCLAAKNPTGGILAEPGIERINATAMTAPLGTFPSKDPANASYNSPTSFQNFIDGYIKPNTIWNPAFYMNIWITNENGSVGLLGYATFPVGTGLTGIAGNGSATTDGLWCWSKAFGSNTIYPTGSYDPTYNKGRTAVHEIGHWVGLRHTWGDGTCLTDYCADTPPSQTSNFGCPTHPYKSGVCAGNTTGEMFQNFMDYTDDPCMYIFTNDQTTRIQTAMQNGTYRNQLSASAATLCTIPASAPIASMSIPASACAGTAVAVNNLSSGSPIPTYSWSASPAGAVFNPNSTATNPTITFATPGSYTVTVVATNSVGSNSNSKPITITTCTTAPVSCNDTLTNFNNTDTLFTYALGGTSTGYVGGNNSYGDKEKAEYFSSTGLVGNANVMGGIVLFYRHATANIGTKGTSNVVFKLYNGNNTSGPSGAAINTFTASLTSILASATATSGVNYCGNPGLAFTSNIIRPYSFNFPVPTNITGDFFLSVKLPSTAGDTAAIFVSSENGRTASTGWELQNPATWVPFNDGTTTSWQLNASLAILPKVACATSINKNSVLDNNVLLYPNPSNGVVNVIATLPNSQSLDIAVYNALGQMVSSSKHNGISNEVFDLDLRNHSSGVYFVTISNGQEKVTKRLILNK